MSIRAQLWVSQLPLDCGLNLGAFRVLDKLADAHNTETDVAIRSADRIATELECSKRTVQRALKDLQLLTFIRRGNQDLVAYLRADRRPVVWSLALELWSKPLPQPVLDGVTAGVAPSGPVDNSYGVTPVVAHGVTSVVTHTGRDTGREKRSLETTTDRASDHEHRFAWVLDSTGAMFGEFCEWTDCRIRRDGRVRIEADGAVRPVRRSA